MKNEITFKTPRRSLQREAVQFDLKIGNAKKYRLKITQGGIQVLTERAKRGQKLSWPEALARLEKK